MINLLELDNYHAISTNVEGTSQLLKKKPAFNFPQYFQGEHLIAILRRRVSQSDKPHPRKSSYSTE
jgi:hypothetical protein